MSEEINAICGQILRQLKSPMERRDDSNLLVIKSQVELITRNNLSIDEKIKIGKQILRQLNVPMRRMDDWNLGIIKEHTIVILQKLGITGDEEANI